MKTNELEIKITDYLDKLGMKRNLKGFRFLRTAISLVAKDWTYLDKMTTRLYPKVADNYLTTPSRAERAIRHSIELVYPKNKPCNSEFIAKVADDLRLQIEGESNDRNTK